jgi:uncharacterized protein (DUF58 family)
MPFTMAFTMFRSATSSIQRRIDAWWLKRLEPTDTLTLTQRNIYILPTRAGWMFALTLLVLLLASINYQLNLGYALTFLLAGSGVVSMHITHNTLRGLCVHLRSTSAVFAGSAAVLDIALSSTNSQFRHRYGIGLRMAQTASSTGVWCDVPAGTHTVVRLGFMAAKRGQYRVPPVRLETRFPMGLFRAWSMWQPSAHAMVYPALETAAPALPQARALSCPLGALRSLDGGEIDGVRSYRRGDSLRHVAWKKSARQMQSGGDLVSRNSSTAVQYELWLDWQDCQALSVEDQLSRLCSWTVQAHQHSMAYGLRLPGMTLNTDSGDAQRQKCLQALALWSAP